MTKLYFKMHFTCQIKVILIPENYLPALLNAAGTIRSGLATYMFCMKKTTFATIL